jgi:hypothetical protein
MKKFKGTHKLLFAICLTLSLQGCGKTSNAPFNPSGNSDNSDQGAPEIFSEATEDSQLSQTEEVHGTRIHQRRFAKVDVAALRKALEGSTRAVTLNLFKNKKITIQLDSISKVSETNYVATGHIRGEVDSSVTLVLKDGVLVLSVKSSSEEDNYEVHFSGQSGNHEITEQTEVEDTEDSCATVQAPVSEGDPIVEEGQDTVLAVPTVKMLVVYTPNARAKAGGTTAMQALIQLGVADANTAFNNSGVNLQVRLAGTLELKSNETTNYSGDLSSLRSSTDSKWNEVHAARTKYGADQVTLIGAYTNVSNPVGIGYFKASKSYAFTIVKYTVISTMFTLAHELGHNIGLNHSDGYVNSQGRFRTVMAYGTYKRIRRFSNPNINYNGYRTGTSSKYSATIINSNSTRMAGLLP